MNTEVELKAHAADPENRRRLEELAGGKGTAFLKDDDYWSRPEDSLRVRVRRERSGSGAAERTLVTWKSKEKRDGIEINEEHEFEANGGEAVEELFRRLGLEKWIHKHKEGRSWTLEGTPPLTAELCEVSGFVIPSGGGRDGGGRDGGGGPAVKNLGWFLELEILLEGGTAASEAEIQAARRRLLEALGQSGLGEEHIEDRYYSELLAP
jgi:adenylate cyclase class 2